MPIWFSSFAGLMSPWILWMLSQPLLLASPCKHPSNSTHLVQQIHSKHSTSPQASPGRTSERVQSHPPGCGATDSLDDLDVFGFCSSIIFICSNQELNPAMMATLTIEFFFSPTQPLPTARTCSKRRLLCQHANLGRHMVGNLRVP